MATNSLKSGLTLSVLGLGLLALAPSCGNSQSSGTSDIFRQDASNDANGNTRRHKAVADERLWTISMNGCTGHLISPDLMMTANHCQAQAGAVYTSGSAMNAGSRDDLSVASVVESSGTLDYSILKVRWTKGSAPADQRFPPLVPTRPADVTVGTGDNEGDELFTVGFPGDKVNTWGATYSEGRAKGVSDNALVYNIGIINGNSGGGVWRKKDHMLVSLTNNGPHSLGQGGWNTADSSDQANWNFGTAMWNIYANSKTLQDVFPGGKNRFTPTDSGTSSNQPGTLFAALSPVVSSNDDNFAMAFAAPLSASKLWVCDTSTVANCTASNNNHETTLVKSDASSTMFATRTALLLSDGMVVTVVALDSQGTQVAAKSLRFKRK